MAAIGRAFELDESISQPRSNVVVDAVAVHVDAIGIDGHLRTSVDICLLYNMYLYVHYVQIPSSSSRFQRSATCPVTD